MLTLSVNYIGFKIKTYKIFLKKEDSQWITLSLYFVSKSTEHLQMGFFIYRPLECELGGSVCFGIEQTYLLILTP